MDKLRVLAEAEGFFTRTDALRIGHDDRSIRRALKARLWARVRPGSYTFPDLWPSVADSQHRVTARAVARKLGETLHSATPRAPSSTTSASGTSIWIASTSPVSTQVPAARSAESSTTSG